jgi:hypothetical protein
MAIVQPIGTGSIDRIEGGGGTMVVLIAMVILFAGATYFTARGAPRPVDWQVYG